MSWDFVHAREAQDNRIKTALPLELSIRRRDRAQAMQQIRKFMARILDSSLGV